MELNITIYINKYLFQQNPLMIRVETKAGHGGGKPTAKLVSTVITEYLLLFMCRN